MTGRLDVEIAGAVATVRIANPAKRNAMTADMWRELPTVLDGLIVEDAVRVVVLRGDGNTFCAGADIANLADVGADTPDANLAVAAEEALARFPKPTIARIEGFCVGGGCQLALACDFRFATADARFGITPAKLGIVYPASSTARLVQSVGPAAARFLLLSAELVGVDRALRWGLIDEIAGEARVDEFAGVLASRSALSQAASKEIIAMAAATSIDADRVAHWMREVRESGEAREGADAFLARRPPSFPWHPHPKIF
ncbi:enoyl-CoA hydratase/carnithine racemase [Allocatelliglobosispora scoriae]|uniref:Enoyl-CoA hydratase/carnithine racemase n=1 Tax=Allocatelliglobosispora scoriae TaxID=643052 RepID=A0A841BTB2_9ACTN|nr:enoyl-CoA hydratase/isomerase family protein [Allocatelliglobosispora scoriae]MBB5869982.1 enoyl-CoA hydratase/carnithine racemase [Allocatelliglobosispora scoriae]